MKLLLLLPLLQAGSLADGLAEVRRLSESGAAAEALALAERLLEPTPSARWREEATAQPGWKRTVVETAGPVLDWFGLSTLSDAERATIHHARGVLMAGSEQRLAAVEAFERARALAGPGELRLDSTYDAGWTWFAEGDAHRAKIPEISGAAPAPAGPPGAEPPAPDPLALARTAYLQARDRFVDRLKLQASDADTRANLELAQRRLKELAEIEKKRQEEKEKQEQKDQQKNEQDPNQDQEKKEDEQKDSESKPDEQPKPDEKQPEEKPEDPEEQEDPKKDAEPKPAKEEQQQLTREEVMRLLDVLKAREEEGKKLLEQLRAARRVSVKKDW